MSRMDMGWPVQRLSFQEPHLILLNFGLKLKYKDDCKQPLKRVRQEKKTRNSKMSQFNGSNVEECKPRTLYIGCLDVQVTEEYLHQLFSQIGPVNVIKLINDKMAESYAFVEFVEHKVALTALAAMNGRILFGKPLKVNWAATNPYGNISARDRINHFHVFVGDISNEVSSEELLKAFEPYGQISDCKVIRDDQTLKSKGYGFISFFNKTDAETAINKMNGQWLGSRSIRTNWATRKPCELSQLVQKKQYTFDEVFTQTGPTNCTVYVGKIPGLDKELVTKLFTPFGPIQEVRIFAEKEYGFVMFKKKESATRAILKMHNSLICGNIIKCWWGKEAPNVNSVSFPPEGYHNQRFNQTYDTTYRHPYGYGHQMNFWPQPPPYRNHCPDPNMYHPQVQQASNQNRLAEPSNFYGNNYRQNFMTLQEQQQENFVQNQLQWTPQCLHYALGLTEPGAQNMIGDSTTTDSMTKSDQLNLFPYKRE